MRWLSLAAISAVLAAGAVPALSESVSPAGRDEPVSPGRTIAPLEASASPQLATVRPVAVAPSGRQVRVVYPGPRASLAAN